MVATVYNLRRRRDGKSYRVVVNFPTILKSTVGT